MSTENPVLENFSGLDELKGLFTKTSLEISELSDGPLTADSPAWRCEASLIPKLGLALRAGFERQEFAAALEPTGLQPEEVELVVISEDPFLKERDIVERILGTEEFPAVLWALNPGEDRRRSLENPSQGLSIGLACVLAKERAPEPRCPYRKGTVVAEVTFFVRPYAGKGQIQPVPLTEEVRKSYHLSSKTQSFVKISEEVVRANPLSEAVTFYVEEDFLKLIQGRSPGDPEFQYVATGLLVNFLQQLTLAASKELQRWREGDLDALESDGSVLIELISDKLGKISRPGAHGTPSLPETARMIRNDPLEVVAHLTALKNFTKNGRQLVTPSAGLED